MKRRFLKKFFYGTTILLSAFIVSIVLYNYSIQDGVIFRGKSLDRKYVYHWKHPFKEVFLPTSNQGEINGLLFQQPNSKGVILYFHGRTGNLAYWGKKAPFFIEQGFDVFIIDYRGFGKSSPGYKEKWFLEDGEVAYNYVRTLYPEEKIIVYGQSLGSSVATWVASKNFPKKLVLEAPFYSMIAAATYTKPYLPEWVVRLMLKYHLRTDKWILKVTSPIYIIHGKEDKIVPFEHAKRLFHRMRDRNKNVRLLSLPDWDHDNLHLHHVYRSHVSEILN